jgi:hypothetical protein
VAPSTPFATAWNSAVEADRVAHVADRGAGARVKAEDAAAPVDRYCGPAALLSVIRKE